MCISFFPSSPTNWNLQGCAAPYLPPGGNVINLSTKVPSTSVIARSAATWQSVFSLVTCSKSGRCKGNGLPHQESGLVRNDREIGLWFLKLMTLPEGDTTSYILYLISHISYLISPFPAPHRKTAGPPWVGTGFYPFFQSFSSGMTRRSSIRVRAFSMPAAQVSVILSRKLPW